MAKTKHLETKYSLAYHNLISKCDGDELRFYLYVKLYAINKNSAYPSQKSFKEDLGLSKYQVDRIAKKMEKMGRLKVERKKGRNNIYDITWYDNENKPNKTSQETLTTSSQETLTTTSQETLTRTINNKTNNNKTIISCDEKKKYTKKDEELVKTLHNTIVERYPHLEDKFNFKKDCEEMNKLHRLDKWTYKQIEYVAKWSQEDQFWRQNIRSVSNLRKHFDKLVIKIKEQRSNNQQIKQWII